MTKDSNIVETEKLGAMYVFSKNNQVYIKNNLTSAAVTNTSATEDEWYPINFNWESL